MDYKKHWNTVYDTKADEQLGWYEDNPKPTLELIEKCKLNSDSKILCVGAGTTRLIDTLIEKGFQNIIANDLSQIALEHLQHRISEKYNHNLECIVDDLTNPTKLNQLREVDLWIDRAVLHFFLEENDIESYFNLIKTTLSKNGQVLIATFSLDGAEKCSGLPLHRYSKEMIKKRLGPDFSLVDSFNYTYINPFGSERPYVYTLFQRKHP